MSNTVSEPAQRDVQVGEQAPDFVLQDENGQQVRLSEQRGQPVVLVFYPFDWSGLCTTELCAIRDDYASFERRGAKVYGINRDSIYTHKAWKEHMGYQNSFLADLDGAVAQQYGCWDPTRNRPDRMTVVIDHAGTIRYVIHNHGGLVRDHHEALAALDEIAAQEGSA